MSSTLRSATSFDSSFFASRLSSPARSSLTFATVRSPWKSIIMCCRRYSISRFTQTEITHRRDGSRHAAWIALHVQPKLPDDDGAMPRVLLTGFCAVPGPRRAGVQLRHVIRALTPHHTVDLLVVREGEQAYVERQGSVRVLRVPTHEADLRVADPGVPARAQAPARWRRLRRRALPRQLELHPGARGARAGSATRWSTTSRASPLGESALDPELDAQYGRDEEACLLAADIVLAPTPAAVKALQGRGKPERVHAVAAGRRRRSVRLGRAAARAARRGSSTPARSIPGRGVRVLVRAMAAIVREVDARLVLAGPIVIAEVRAGAARRHPRARPDRQGRAARPGRSRSAAGADRDRDGVRRARGGGSDAEPDGRLSDEAARVHGVPARDRRAAPRDRADGRRERPRGAAVRARRSDRPRAQGAAPDRRAAAARPARRRRVRARAPRLHRERRAARAAQGVRPCSPSGSRRSSPTRRRDDELAEDRDARPTTTSRRPCSRRRRTSRRSTPRSTGSSDPGGARRAARHGAHQPHESVRSRRRRPQPDETMERAPVAPGPRKTPASWTGLALARRRRPAATTGS